MVERSVPVNPNICINPIVWEAANGKGFCNPEYRRKFFDETTGCASCPKPGRVGALFDIADRKSFMSPEEIKAAEIAVELRKDRIRRAARSTGKYLRI